MKLVSWNCRELGSPNKMKAVKDLLKMEPTNILLLKETKMGEESLLDMNRENWKKQGGCARGASNGLATLWNKNEFSLPNSFSTQHWIFIELQHLPSKVSLSLFNLYVPMNYLEKNYF